MSSRPTRDQVYLSMAEVFSQRGTCARRQVACLLVNERGRILSGGYNGPPSGWDHCIDKPCPGATAESGDALDLCEAIHAEANALLQCPSVQDIRTAYCTDSPCIHCVKLLLNTPCERIVFLVEYPHDEARNTWLKAGRLWEMGTSIIKLDRVYRSKS